MGKWGRKKPRVKAEARLNKSLSRNKESKPHLFWLPSTLYENGATGKKKKKRKVISGRMTLKFSKVMNGSCQQT